MARPEPVRIKDDPDPVQQVQHVVAGAILSEAKAVATVTSTDSNKTIKNEENDQLKPRFENEEWCQFLDTQVKLGRAFENCSLSNCDLTQCDFIFKDCRGSV